MDNIKAVKALRHPTFYLPLGDLVVQSASDEYSTQVVLFRVNKSILAFNSPVFADMFTLPTTAVQELYDGAPMVCLTDTAEELTALFSALHNPSFLSFSRFDPDIPAKLTNVMRIATKYQIDTVRRRIIDIMHDSWPQTFEHWLRYQSEIAVLRTMHAGRDDGLVDGKSFEECIPEPASAIRFAQDFDVPSILPFAFYTLAGIPIHHDWDEMRKGNGHKRSANARTQSRTARWDLLDVQDYKKVMAYREALAERVCQVVLARYGREEAICSMIPTGTCTELSEGPYGGYGDRPDCNGAMYQALELWKDLDTGILREDALTHATGHPDPLGLLEQLYNSHPQWKICRACQESLQKDIRESQEVIWQNKFLYGHSS
ncbi:hypothetical protein PHLGIDRAFT_127803 [Phlebiopsis gigantea 11061_1 CR5-6]|uniref:BTB domain-containing protein n=1 Tax=Phlebiopsis gigantea (strain 11061_1 CR5-6) TaxID=745531 RepID=A0A0C3PL81_PHLG1|nr:hypothetical protein PHLGIDRAFT_127803 [Phlebiopsis gigantea 11061_1 CR5-6]